MVSFGLWLAGILGKNVSDKTAGKIGALGALVILVPLALLLLWVGKNAYDNGVREQAQTERTAEVAVGARAADEKADAALKERVVKAEAENKRLEKAMDDAERKDPEGAAKPVGPVQQSYFDNLPKR